MTCFQTSRLLQFYILYYLLLYLYSILFKLYVLQVETKINDMTDLKLNYLVHSIIISSSRQTAALEEIYFKIKGFSTFL